VERSATSKNLTLLMTNGVPDERRQAKFVERPKPEGPSAASDSAAALEIAERFVVGVAQQYALGLAIDDHVRRRLTEEWQITHARHEAELGSTACQDCREYRATVEVRLAQARAQGIRDAAAVCRQDEWCSCRERVSVLLPREGDNPGGTTRCRTCAHPDDEHDEHGRCADCGGAAAHILVPREPTT